jgi:hypothetical protein
VIGGSEHLATDRLKPDLVSSRPVAARLAAPHWQIEFRATLELLSHHP